MNFWLSAVASVGLLGLALLVFRKAWRTPLGFPLTLLCLSMFTWNTANLLFVQFQVDLFHLLDIGTSPMTVPLALHFVISFVGRLRQLRIPLTIVYLFYAGLSVSAFTNFALTGTVEVVPPPVWSAAFLIGMVPALGLAIGLLVVHLHHAVSPQEQARTRLLFGGLAVGAIFGSTELLNNFVDRIPSLGHIGSLASVALLMAAVSRFRLVGDRLRRTHFVYALSLASAGLVGMWLATRAFTGSTAFLMLSTAVVGIVLVVATRELVASVVQRNARTAELAHLGRFSAQMAHDLKNPLAAIKGAAQYLEAEVGGGSSIDDHAEFVALLNKQADRMRDIVDKYNRMSRIEPHLGRIDLNELVHDAVSSRDEVVWGLSEEPVLAIADPDLVLLVVENLVANARDAIETDGQITISTALMGTDWATVTVSDTGLGMDARVLERAFDDFYTTKATGSGMGLAFAQRVVDAHDGRIEIRSEIDVGTDVIVRLPAYSEELA